MLDSITELIQTGFLADFYTDKNAKKSSVNCAAT